MGAQRKPWTDAHRREALRRTYEIAAEVCEENASAAAELCEVPINGAYDEATWRTVLGCAIDAARINREVCRVRDLAEGRLVRETVWDVVSPRGVHEERHSTPAAAERAKQFYGQGYQVVRITRIRKAVKP